ncbi:MAG: hypothetical protein M3Q46_04860, partial [Verrucomicrobiota bacterium]|nr:hypothetical protein [Verrucomicrobiota bacterium]
RYDLGIIELGAGIFMLFGVALVIYGFRKWRVLQLKQDQLLEFELQSSVSLLVPRRLIQCARLVIKRSKRPNHTSEVIWQGFWLK